jgi:hypothetical protein
MPTRRLWRAPSLLVVELRDSADRIPGSFAAAMPPEGCHDYALVDPEQGRVVEQLEAWTQSIEDERWAAIHAVAGDRLEQITLIERYGADTIETRRRTRVEGLRAAGDPASRAIADDAVARHLAERTAARDRAAQAGNERVAAIAGALDDLGLGPDVARAQARLRERIAWYDDILSADLLPMLVDLAARCRAAPAALPAMSAFARACRHQCFDKPEPAPARSATALDAGRDPIVQRLAGLEQKLLQHAEWQEDIDAGSTARSYRDAAAAIHEAAVLLAGTIARR